jgi:hypothetical protein
LPASSLHQCTVRMRSGILQLISLIKEWQILAYLPSPSQGPGAFDRPGRSAAATEPVRTSAEEVLSNGAPSFPLSRKGVSAGGRGGQSIDASLEASALPLPTRPPAVAYHGGRPASPASRRSQAVR